MAAVLVTVIVQVLALALGAAPVHAQERSLARATSEALARPVIGQASVAGATSAGAPASSALGTGPDQAARSDYLLHCSGCHGDQGAAHALGRIPPLQGVIGRFLHLPQGRAFLVQVPGVHNSGLDDARIARLMNWLVPQFAGPSLLTRFQPFSAEEVGRLRADRPADPARQRRELAAILAGLGSPIDY